MRECACVALSIDWATSITIEDILFIPECKSVKATLKYAACFIVFTVFYVVSVWTAFVRPYAIARNGMTSCECRPP